MKIIFLGDSITEGVGASAIQNRYVDKVAEICNAETRCFGVSGTRIARQTNPTIGSILWDYDFQMRAEVMDKDADAVFVYGGTNDYGHGDATIGNESDTSPYTFYGALNNLIRRLSEIYGKEKIHFILPSRRFVEDDVFGQGFRNHPTLPLKGYVDIIRNTCEKQGIGYIDLFDNGFEKPQCNTGDEYTVDGLHPNDKGHLFIAEKIKEYINTKLF